MTFTPAEQSIWSANGGKERIFSVKRVGGAELGANWGGRRKGGNLLAFLVVSKREFRKAVGFEPTNKRGKLRTTSLRWIAE